MARTRTRVVLAVPPPNTVNSPFERFFIINYGTKTWDMLAYDPNFIKNSVSYDEVNELLRKIA